MRALLSVSDKRGLVEFGRGLLDLGYELVSTGGTQKALVEAGLAVRAVSDVTGFPEILDGRVKTLHPAIHGGILARKDRPEDLDELSRLDITAIDLVCGNLYPFYRTVTQPGVSLAEALEQIDIGGPAMIRASAKNHPSVLVVCDPSDYDEILAALRDGSADAAFRRRLAAKAFQHVANYDTAIAQYLRADDETFPDELTFALSKVQDLRYGENPHQRAAFYRELAPRIVGLRISEAKQLHGAELSFNNILDADAALNVVADFLPPTVAVIKHTNPCGLACRETLVEAYRRAFEGDTVSAFGGIVALNRKLDIETAREMSGTFYEIVIAPSYDEDALALLKKKRNLRILETGNWLGVSDQRASMLDSDDWDKMVAQAQARSAAPSGHYPIEFDVRRVSGGFLVQTRDHPAADSLKLQVVTKRAPTLAELTDLLFGWRAVKHIKSNAIVLTRNLELVGMGAGQPNRVTSVGLALDKAGDKAHGSVLASDAFFPFPDGVEKAAIGGVTAIIQPGGSIRDEESIRMADRHHVAMVFTGMRHFRH